MAETEVKPPSKPSSKIPLPQDREAKLSVLLWASDLVQQERVTYLAFKDEVNQQQVKGLSRTTRDVEKANNQWLEVHIRRAGDLMQLDTTSRIQRPPNYLLAGTIVFATLAALMYLGIYPHAWLTLLAWWAINGMYALVTVFMVIAIMLMLFWRRRRRKTA